MKKQTLADVDVKNKKVIVRVDFNVPVKDGLISNDNRIVEALPTINYLLSQGAAVILMSHLGRPDGKKDMKYSLSPVAIRLSELLGQEVKMSKDVVGTDAKKLSKNLKSGEVLLLENLRFHKEEEGNDAEFAKKLAALADVYVNDAFGTAHRKHASTYGVAKLLPNAVGYLIEKELKMIEDTIANPTRPFLAILGGAKVKDKIGIIDCLINKCDSIIIGGGMSYTFLKAKGYEIGTSLVDDTKIADAKKLMKKAEKKGTQILFPVDYVVANNFENPTEIKVVDYTNIPANFMGMDIGPKTIKLFKQTIKKAKSIIWNGPMGVFENPKFAKGTNKVAKAMCKNKGTTIVGGGDSASAVINMGLKNKFTHVSTGGGASMELFEGKVLPGVDVIKNKK